MSSLLKVLAKRIVVDVDPSQFVFSCETDNIHLAIAPFLYIDDSKRTVVAVGDAIPPDDIVAPDVHCIDVFDTAQPLPFGSAFERVDLIQLLFEYGIGRIFEKHILPSPRPVLIIKGVERFNGLLDNPRQLFGTAGQRAGACEVVFGAEEVKRRAYPR